MKPQSENTIAVCMWVSNDEGLYNLAKQCRAKRKTPEGAAALMKKNLEGEKTPDGDRYTLIALKTAIEELDDEL